MKVHALLLCVSTTLIFALSAAGGESCEQAFEVCRQHLELHTACAEEHPGAVVNDAAAIFELQHRLETSTSMSSKSAFGADASNAGHLRSVLDGLLDTADPSLAQPGRVESILIGDLHFRHAERLGRLLAAPAACKEASAGTLERSCRAGVGEARALTRTGWPSSVATCID